MPPSQLKKLKAQLRENGVLGQQKSKKQQRLAINNGTLKGSRMTKNATLQTIREQFNPFEAKPASHGKHDVTSHHRSGGTTGESIVARPGTTKRLGEENRRKTLLLEAQRRKKVGGVLDRRFGENDATLTLEEKALHRFVAEKQRSSTKNSAFDLEDEEQDDGKLTHSGQPLSFIAPNVEDLENSNLETFAENLNYTENDDRAHKRRRISENEATADEHPDSRERQKTKKEVMSEVISKSKLGRYERQQAKDDDDDLRAELDKDMPNLYALMRGDGTNISKHGGSYSTFGDLGSMNPARMAILNGKGRSQADQEYDQRLRQMALEQRAKPTVATLTTVEKAAREAQQLNELERRRLQRMNGESTDSESERQSEKFSESMLDAEGSTFNLGLGLSDIHNKQELGVEDEDDFVIDGDLVNIGLGDETSSLEYYDQSIISSEKVSVDDSDDGNDEVTAAEKMYNLLYEEDSGTDNNLATDSNTSLPLHGVKTKLAFTYPCPQTHEDFLNISKSIALKDLPLVVQRIRTLYQPQLAKDNKAKLGKFSGVLVDHISHMANTSNQPPYAVFEALIRHIHSLAKTFPKEVGGTFRNHLRSIHETRPTNPTTGDLMIFTAISSIFPTSDQFHQVATPAMLCMTQYLSQKIPSTLNDITTGTYVVSLCLLFQILSRRYVPEIINYVLNTIFALIPAKSTILFRKFSNHVLPENLRITTMLGNAERGNQRLSFWGSITQSHPLSPIEEQRLKYTLLSTHLSLVEVMANVWAGKPAFCEMLDPIYVTLKFVSSNRCSATLGDIICAQAQSANECILQLLENALQARQPLRLHNHRPLAIKPSLPKFEDSYGPDKHYDPDRDRAELSKLKAEHKKERKGALRELRKDANFLARESLREKKERDSAYEKKFKRLVAEIQGEEGREAKIYEREKRIRKGKM